MPTTEPTAVLVVTRWGAGCGTCEKRSGLDASNCPHCGAAFTGIASHQHAIGPDGLARLRPDLTPQPETWIPTTGPVA
ncbi:hypothetical protein ABT354_25335 [Streptomyces sp. NPDC000594]|uniref:hypothetical protein n=1 Tax=Streptomyces sp. NPDC000594 TaxID=3154261 RepID=UPI003327CA19